MRIYTQQKYVAMYTASDTVDHDADYHAKAQQTVLYSLCPSHCL